MTKRACRPGDWILHIGGMAAFTATFAALPVLCAGVALGFDILQALLINLALFCSGTGSWMAIRLHRWMGVQRQLAVCRKAGAAFARKPLVTHAKARTFSRPGPQPVAGFEAFPI